MMWHARERSRDRLVAMKVLSDEAVRSEREVAAREEQVILELESAADTNTCAGIGAS